MNFLWVFSLIVGTALAGDYALESNFYREEPCAKAGGHCVLESECPNPVIPDHKGLCSGQKKDGAICCVNFPEEHLNCHQLHNVCSASCPSNLNRGRKGCPDGQNCCDLI